LKLGLVGCGAIGSTLANYIKDGKAGDNKLIGICDVNKASLNILNKTLALPGLQVTTEPDELIQNKRIELIVEAANQLVVRKISEKVIDVGKSMLIMSVGALTDEKLLARLEDRARKKNVKIYLPSGAICGLDGVKAASIGNISKVELTTTKNPKSLAGAPYIVDQKISLQGLREPNVIFEGNAREAAKEFPQNINVAVALSLAGIGVEGTRVKIVADPSSTRTKHEITVVGEFGDLYTVVNNFVHPQNPKTSYIAALSAIRVLKKIVEPIQVGT
jgi:aspartate dehydrogenase